jgi:hypothetical protein
MSAKQTSDTFWARVRGGSDDECWEWTGCVNSTGYGTVSWHGKHYTAHRVAAWLSGLVDAPDRPVSSRETGHVLHTCDNRRCCNPNHFFLGSFADNQRDAYRKKRRAQPRGEAHTNAKLTNQQAVEIRQRYATGEYQVPLAKEYGVSQRVISLIVRGETYKCL